MLNTKSKSKLKPKPKLKPKMKAKPNLKSGKKLEDGEMSPNSNDNKKSSSVKNIVREVKRDEENDKIPPFKIERPPRMIFTKEEEWIYNNMIVNHSRKKTFYDHGDKLKMENRYLKTISRHLLNVPSIEDQQAQETSRLRNETFHSNPFINYILDKPKLLKQLGRYLPPPPPPPPISSRGREKDKDKVKDKGKGREL